MKKAQLPGSILKCTVAALALGTTGLASAAEPGFYLAGTVGQSSADFSQSDHDDLDELTIGAIEATELDLVGALDSHLDKSGMGYELAVGYQFNQYVAVEAAYVDLGDATYTADAVVTDGEDQFDATNQLKFGVSGPSLTVVGMWPFASNFALDARAGALFGKSKMKITVSIDGFSESESASDSKTSLLFGAGVSWSFLDAASVRLGYALAQKSMMDEFDVGRMSLTLKYAF